MSKLIKFFTVVSLIVLASACASPELANEPAGEFANEGLHRVKSSGFEQAYIFPGAGLSEYAVVKIDMLDVSSLHVTQTTVSGTTRQSWQMNAERESRLADAWASATGRAFNGYDNSGEGAKVLVIRAQLTRISPSRTTTTATSAAGTAIRGSSDVVDASAEFRLYDKGNNQLLAVIRDTRTIASLQWSRAAGADMVNLFNSWAALLHTRVSGR